MDIKQYKITPKAPEILNEDGQKFWTVYCKYYLDRQYLTEDLLPDIEHLANLQQQRVIIQKLVNDSIGTEEYERKVEALKSLSIEIRQYKKHMGIYTRANEFHKVKDEDDEDNEESANVTLLKKAKDF